MKKLLTLSLCTFLFCSTSNAQAKIDTSGITFWNGGFAEIKYMDTVKNLIIVLTDTGWYNFNVWSIEGFAIPNKNTRVQVGVNNYDLNRALHYGTDNFKFYYKDGYEIPFIVIMAKTLNKK